MCVGEGGTLTVAQVVCCQQLSRADVTAGHKQGLAATLRQRQA